MLMGGMDSTVTGREAYELLRKRHKSLYQKNLDFVKTRLEGLSQVFEGTAKGLAEMWSCAFKDENILDRDLEPLANTFVTTSIRNCPSFSWGKVGACLGLMPSLAELTVEDSGCGD